jgi:ubiquitin-conjugating enzyme E2 J2
MSPTELCTKRLKKELRDLQKKPLESIRALPLESNLLEWHYVIEGLKEYRLLKNIYFF